ncbi:MAG: pyruvate formate-lyase, partial [Clostridia bacterium]|nr:pyruvate formate-lyase [Clostridia bacterium]
MELREYITKKLHRKLRKTLPQDLFCEEFSRLGLSPGERMTRRFEYMTSHETPVIMPGEIITFSRTLANLPDCFTKEEWEKIRKEHFIHELGYNSNLCIDWEGVLSKGLLSYREGADEYGRRMIDALLALCERYRHKAIEENRPDIAKVLERVPAYPARTLREAMQSFRAVHFALWLEGNYHNTCGRFDLYAGKYLEADMKNGILDRESALALVEDFFLSFNKDNDLYVGIQQGDNGQSMMLGGVDREGKPVFNLLSELCLEASFNNKLIDPKINVRVGRDTPDEIYRLGSRLTVAGLGFPQYSNDDVVIDGLVKKGYELSDARDYTVAACWEFIIPKYGCDVCNIGSLSFPKAVDEALHEKRSFGSYEEFENAVLARIDALADAECEKIKDLWFVPSPFLGMFLEPKYHNFGIHGSGIATAADSLEAIRETVFEEKLLSFEELKSAVDRDFVGDNKLLNTLRTKCAKTGQDDDRVDGIAAKLLGRFAEALENKTNCLGGVFRAGTGTAMFYLAHADAIGASPDGRRKGEPFGTNFSPSLFARIPGPFSVISSFTKPELVNAVNGGPLTLEFAAATFIDPESIEKLAMLVKDFVLSGGHQLQLNAVNADKLKDAQRD